MLLSAGFLNPVKGNLLVNWSLSSLKVVAHRYRLRWGMERGEGSKVTPAHDGFCGIASEAMCALTALTVDREVPGSEH